MELDEVLLMFQNFLKQLLSTCASPNLLAVAHLLLKALNSARFFLTCREDSGAFVKITVYQLPFIQVVAFRFCYNL